MRAPARVVLLAIVVALACGCGRKPDPLLAPASGVVRLGGKPLESALVRFMPAEQGIAAEWISEGTTDMEGRYTLACVRGPGAVVGKHRVTVSEGGVPGELRDDQGKVGAWLSSLSGRPIPDRYGTAATSPLEVTVGPEGVGLDLDLDR